MSGNTTTPTPAAPTQQVPTQPNSTPAGNPTPAPAVATAPTGQQQQHEERTYNQKYVDELRAEAASYRVNARQAAEARDAAERAAAEAHERAQQTVQTQVQPLQQRLTRLQDRAVMSELRAIAIAEGIEDLDFVPLIDRSKITIDDDGNITGVTEAVAAQKAAKPKWYKSAQQATPPTPTTQTTPTAAGAQPAAPAAPARPSGSGARPAEAGDPTSTRVTTLSKAEYNSAKNDILRSLKAGNR
jgi:hypothetical protein